MKQVILVQLQGASTDKALFIDGFYVCSCDSENESSSSLISMFIAGLRDLKGVSITYHSCEVASNWDWDSISHELKKKSIMSASEYEHPWIEFLKKLASNFFH